MKDHVDTILGVLSESNIRYYLLRPVNLADTVKDLDMIVPKEDMGQLAKALLTRYGSYLYKKSHARESVQLVANTVILDIKFKICFLPGKSLVLSKEVPYAGIKKIGEQILVPSCPPEVLFTFWTYHLFLDKISPEASSTYTLYRQFYKEEWEACIHSPFFGSWTEVLFKNGSRKAIEILTEGFTKEMQFSQRDTSRPLRKLLFRHRPALQLIYVFDRIKYGLYRRIRIHGNYREIREVAH